MYSIDLGLLQYLDKIRRKIYYTNFTDTIIDSVAGELIYGGNDLKNYRKKVEFYLKEHSNRLSVYKLRNNKKLSEADLKGSVSYGRNLALKMIISRNMVIHR